MKKLLCLGCVALLFAGCATNRQPPIALTGDIMVDGPNAIANGPARDKVLWQYRTALAAMRRGQFDEAKRYLDDALLTLGGIYGPNKSAKQARSYFRAEAKKTFIGEPYERAMAFYYRGILYWMDGQPDNARACFRSMEIEDSDAENHEYRGDWVLADYLDGLATSRLGGDGSDAFNRAEAAARLAKPPAYQHDGNVLFFVNFGPGPVKYATGEYGEQLRFRTPSSPVQSALVEVDGQSVKASPYDDVDFQATTRGGRVMDYVLGNKAVFKSATGGFGTAAIVGGAIMAGQQGHNSAVDEVGLGLVAAGVISQLFSSATTPQADTRTWDNLPHYLSFASLSLPAGDHPATVAFYDSAGHILPNLTKHLTIHVPQDGATRVVFVSDQSSTPQTL